MNFSVLTLFPQMIEDVVNTSIIGRAKKNNLINVNAINIRDFSDDKHGKVDDYTYGGGAGMLIQAEPVFKAFNHASNGKKVRTVYVTPQGKPFCQDMAKDFAKEDDLVIICGHYEGIDERVLEEVVTDYVSVGDFVLTGGELAALIIIDATSRFISGVLSNDASSETESFHMDLLEYPQYTRPEEWHGKKVPEVLLTGNHKDVEAWRLEKSIEKTKAVRPDLYKNYEDRIRMIDKLSKKKRNNIFAIESLKSGRGKVVFENDDLVIIEEGKGNFLEVSFKEDIFKDAENLRHELYGTVLKKGAVRFYTADPNLKDLIERENIFRNFRSYRMFCYTVRENLKCKADSFDNEKYDFESIHGILIKTDLTDENIHGFSFLVNKYKENGIPFVFCTGDENASVLKKLGFYEADREIFVFTND
ncbi:MAG: tRNA (guanosine(37)-N1)-methyltransferase TrmD [Lachnospiraceae bacterium]|nr:tRNA (guanosine(37)-N1)-methyltransferase TrmD [Lachnospiraceae bacterium]